MSNFVVGEQLKLDDHGFPMPVVTYVRVAVAGDPSYLPQRAPMSFVTFADGSQKAVEDSKLSPA